LWKEPGFEALEEAMTNGLCLMSAMNAAEVASKLAERGATHQQIDEALAGLSVNVVPFDRAAAIDAGMLREQTRSAGLSLGDRAALVLARARNVPAFTTDRAWLAVSLGVDVRFVRPDSP
jgi:PIN domain nuclease of toxin-antitoxin system